MKFWKKPLALTLALAVVMSCGLVAMAEEGSLVDASGDSVLADPFTVGVLGSVNNVKTAEDVLIEAIAGGGTVTLTGDVKLTQTLEITNEVTIDGRGFSITAAGIPRSEKSQGHGILISKAAGKVTLKNLVVKNAEKYGIQAYCSDNVVLENVDIQNSKSGGLYVNASNVTATNLTLLDNTWGGVEVGISEGITNRPANFKLNSYKYGTVLNKPVVWIDGPKTNKIEIAVPDSLIETVNNGDNSNQVWYSIKQMAESELRNAILNNSSVTLTGNVQLTSTLKIEKPVTINGNGYTITAAGIPSNTSAEGHGILINSGDGSVVIKNIFVSDAPKYGIQAYCSNNVTLENVTIQNANYGGAYVNASTVKASNLALKNNGWGGVEVGLGVGLSDAKSNFTLTSYMFDSDSDKPVIWIDGPENSNVKITAHRSLIKEVSTFTKPNDQTATQVWYTVDPDYTPGGSTGGGTATSPTENTANSSETTSKIADAASALKTAGAALPQGVVAAQVPNASGISTPITVVPVSLTSGSAALSVGTVNTIGSVPANVGIQASIDNGAAIVTLTGGFGRVTEPGRFFYPMDFAPKAPDSATMLGAVKSVNATSDAFKLGANFTLPKPANLSVSTPIANGTRVNIYVFNPETGRFTLVASTTVANGRLNFATATFGQFLVTTGRI